MFFGIANEPPRPVVPALWLVTVLDAFRFDQCLAAR
jgi:hypothetical protein